MSDEMQRLLRRRCVSVYYAAALASLLFTAASLLYYSPLVGSSSTVAPPGLASYDQLSRVLNENSVLRAQLKRYQVEDVSNEEECQTIDVAMVCGGHNATRSAVVVLKSILFHRGQYRSSGSLLRLHLVVDNSSRLILDRLLSSWRLPSVEYFFYSADKLKPAIEWIPNKHYSGVYGLMKLTLAYCLPATLDKVIVLDTDLTFAADIHELWSIFARFTPEQVIGLVENQSDWYLGKLWKNHQPWPALGRGFNTGVILLRLAAMRDQHFLSAWTSIAKHELKYLLTTSLADQDIFNAYLKHNPQLLYRLPCAWNYQLSYHTLADLCQLNLNQVKVIHWNSPAKLAVRTQSISRYFRDLTRTFTVYDGALLRRGPACSTNQSRARFEPTPPADYDNDCIEFKHTERQSLRMHLYYLDYDWSAIDREDVTLVLQCSIDRVQMLEALIAQWQGPISVALYLSDSEAADFLSYAVTSATLMTRRNVGFHVAFKDGRFYPVNSLRNIALKQVNTDYVFLCDVDFLPSSDLHELLNLEAKEKLSDSVDRVLVVAAFETISYRFEMPRTKDELLNMMDAGQIVTFRHNEWEKGHIATNYSKWIITDTSYRIHWKSDYEPYLVGKTSRIIDYDERFVGFGWNKVSHIMELDALGFEFHVLPNLFIVHQPHAPSLEISRYRTDPHYRRCLKLLKEDFQKYLSQTYGLKALKYLEMD